MESNCKGGVEVEEDDGWKEYWLREELEFCRSQGLRGVSVAVHFSWREDTRAMALDRLLFVWFYSSIVELQYSLNPQLLSRLRPIHACNVTRYLSFLSLGYCATTLQVVVIKRSSLKMKTVDEVASCVSGSRK